MKKPTREWIHLAEGDWRTAAKLRTEDDPHNRIVCFLCQQSAEKYLKALLQEGGMSIPKTHDLIRLLSLLLAAHPTLISIQTGLDKLSEFAVDVRYPGSKTTKRDATSAVRWATKVRAECRRILKIRDRKSRKSP